MVWHSHSPVPEQTHWVIETHGLRKSFHGILALQSLDLRIPRHAICGFLGPNGAGKSSAIKLLLGLARPSGGTGMILGYDIVRESLAIRQRVGYLAQDPRFYEDMTARETLRFAARFFYRGPQQAIEQRVADSLALVGLIEKADRPVRGFSGGERQRLGIAQAQINHPELLILDEPAASLDPLGRRDVLAIMERLRSHTTIFYSTHLLDDVQRVSDMVVIVNQGKVLVQDSIETLLAGGGALAFVVTLQGDTRGAYARLTAAPWVTAIDERSTGSPTRWHVIVNDEQAARTQLLSLITADGSVEVLEFGRAKDALEDVFVRLVEGGPHGH